jgi:Transposase.
MKHGYMDMMSKLWLSHLSRGILNCQDGEKKPPVWSNMKILLTVFFNYNNVVHYEFLPEVHTVNKEYYLKVMRHLHQAI